MDLFGLETGELSEEAGVVNEVTAAVLDVVFLVFSFDDLHAGFRLAAELVGEIDEGRKLLCGKSHEDVEEVLDLLLAGLF